jgi:hypothetical protein
VTYRHPAVFVQYHDTISPVRKATGFKAGKNQLRQLDALVANFELGEDGAKVRDATITASHNDVSLPGCWVVT